MRPTFGRLTGDDLHALWGQGSLRLLAGCAPCQPFSTYSRRSRSPLYDEKWHLVAEFGRLVRESTPDFITLENVPQLVDHLVFQQLLAALCEYYVWWDVVQCINYGVPQTRKRLVLIASRFGEITLVPPRGGDVREATVRNTISRLPPLQAGETDPDDFLHSSFIAQ